MKKLFIAIIGVLSLFVPELTVSASSPDTGDTRNPLVFIIIGAVALLLIVALIILKIKSKKK